MDLLAIGRAIAPFAPLLGRIVGGFIPFPGASLVTEGIGNLIANAFGVPPDATSISNALNNTPEAVAIAKLQAVADEAKAKWPAVADIYKAEAERDARVIESVNLTMRGELAHQHWFFTGWRPACGWVFVIFAIIFGALLCWSTLQAIAGDGAGLKVMTDAWPIYLAYFGTLAAMVGVYVIGRSREKEALLTTVPAPPAVVPTTRKK